MWWHWRDGRPLHPVVVGFEYDLMMWVELRIMARHGGCPSELVLRGRIGNRVLAGGVTDFPDELPGDRLLLLWPDDPLPYGGAVRQWTMPIQFDYSVDGGRRWHMLRYAGPTAWYVVPWAYTYAQYPYDFGFERFASHAMGAQDEEGMLARLNMGIAETLCYDPAQPDPPDPDRRILRLYEWGRAQCSGNSLLLKYLSELGSIDGHVRFSWGGLDATRWDFYVQQGGDPPVSFQLRAPKNDRAPPDPHFTFHAVYSSEGRILDPSYGEFLLADAIELAPQALQQEGWALPPFERRFLSDFECDHPPVPLDRCP